MLPSRALAPGPGSARQSAPVRSWAAPTPSPRPRRRSPGRRRSGLDGCPRALAPGSGRWQAVGADGTAGGSTWRATAAGSRSAQRCCAEQHQGADDRVLVVAPRALAPGPGRWQAVGADGTAGGSTWQATAAATSTRWSAPRALAPVGSWAAPSPRPRRRSPGRRRSGLDGLPPGSGAGLWEVAAVGADGTAGGSTWRATAAATLTRAPTIGP